MTDKLTYEQILSHFVVEKRHGDTAQVKCTGHDDRKGSLSIDLKDGKVVMFCHAGCLIDTVLTNADLKISDLFLNGTRNPESLYQYHNTDGSLAYEKEKYRNADGSKDFKYRHVTPEGTLSYTKGDSRILYRILQFKEALNKGDLIVYPEGEKDCNTAVALGYTSTTMGGVSDWKPEYASFFKGARLVIPFDKDKAGIDLAVKMIDSLKAVCKSLKGIVLPGDSKDISDWVCAGHNRQELDQIIAAAPELAIKKNTPDKFDWHDQAVNHGDLINKQLSPLTFQVEELIIDTGTGILGGIKKLGKSFMGSQLAISKATGNRFLGRAVKKGRVVYFALEDGERRMQSRLKMQHAAGHAMDIIYFYKWPALNTPEGKEQLKTMLAELKPELVIIDTLAKSLNGKPDQNAAGDMAEFGNEIHDIALEYQTFILFIAHHGKGLGKMTRDPGFDIRGSSAIPGSTDVNIGLYRNEDKTFQLIGEGRDFGEFDFRVSLDKEQTWAWQLEGDTQDLRRKEAEDKIIDALKVLGKADAQAIAQEIDSTRQNVGQHLKRIRDYENSPIKAIVDKKKILYSLSSLSVLSGSSNLSSLSDGSMESPENVLKVKTTQGYLHSPESDESKATDNGKVCPFCDSNKLVKQPEGDFYCKDCSNTSSDSGLKTREES